MLTLLLQSLKWNDISERKKEKAIKKLSRFFLVPRVSFSNIFPFFSAFLTINFHDSFSFCVAIHHGQ